MILKSFLVERNIKSLDTYFAALFYGENIGLKDEFKKEIKRIYKTHEQFSFSQNEIIKNKKILDEEINNRSLFSKNKIIIIYEVSEKIKNIIIPILDEPRENIKIFLFSENLDKKSSIRAYFEKNKKTGTIPCYQDNERTLSEYIRNKLKDYQGLTQDLINVLINNSGLDRKTVSNEIDKITHLFLDKKIDGEKLSKLINNRSNLDFDNLRDSCLSGDQKLLNKNLGSITLQNENIYFYLNNLNFRIKKLLDLRLQYEKDKNIEVAMDNMKPKIFWKDRPVFYKQIKKWNLKKLEDAKKSLVHTEILMKTRLNTYNEIIIKELLIRLYQKAISAS
tara:strand:- start:1648 stop:2652 length:1005 start_codon:yes stop_codon:yes gene_type:complete